MAAENEVIHQGWLNMCTEKSGSKAWLMNSFKKSWKKKYFALYRVIEDPDKVFLAAFEKQEDLHPPKPKKLLSLFPRYRIAKQPNAKGRENVLEVDNEEDTWLLAAENPKMLDLWAVQIQMQTKLSRSISGRIFTVSGAYTKDMQRIGAAQQRCLLHFTRWGVTLALQDCRSILAMWPLSTIRNYECTGSNQFSIEAGRRAPMGEGKYLFNTHVGQDEEMFRVIDIFVSARLNERAEIGSPGSLKEVTDDEILKTYDQLHRAATGLAGNEELDLAGYHSAAYSHIKHSITTQQSIPVFAESKPPDYNHLYARDDPRLPSPHDASPAGSPSSGFASPRTLSFTGAHQGSAYDRLDRVHGSASPPVEYDRLHASPDGRDGLKIEYDHIDRCGAHPIVHSDYSRLRSTKGELNMKCDSSVSHMAETEGGTQSPSISANASDEGEFSYRNPFYSTIHDNSSLSSDHLPNDDVPHERPHVFDSHKAGGGYPPVYGLDSAEDPVSGANIRSRTGSSLSDKYAMSELADHFLYQIPSSLASGVNARSSAMSDQRDVPADQELYLMPPVAKSDRQRENSGYEKPVDGKSFNRGVGSGGVLEIYDTPRSSGKSP